MNSIRTRILKGIGSSLFGKGVTIVIQIVSVPLYLHYWGTELYGEWLVLFSIPAYLTMANLGFASVAANRMTMEVTKGNQDNALESFQSTMALILGLSITLIAILYGLCQWLPYYQWLNFDSLNHTDTNTTVLLLSAYSLLGFMSNLYQSGFRCIGEFAQGNFLGSIIRLVEQLLALIWVYFGATPVQLATYFVGAQVAGAFVMWWCLRRDAPWLTTSFTHVSWTEIKSSMTPGLAFISFPLANAFSLQGTLLIISIAINTQAVVVYSTLRTLTRLGVQLSNSISAAIWPEVSMAEGAEDIDRLRKLHTLNTQSIFALAALLSVGLWYCGEYVYATWTQRLVTFETGLFALLIASMLINQAWQGSFMVLLGTNRHVAFAKTSLYNSFALIGFTYYFCVNMGVKGAGLSLVLFELVALIFATKLALPVLEESFSTMLKRILKVVNPMKLS